MRTPANPLDSLIFPPEIDTHMRALIPRVGGEFWRRGVIEPKTRSLTTMAVLCTRNLQDELALHVRLGIERYGTSRAEICEVIAHCALYAGFPTAVAAFRTVAQVFATLDALEAAQPSD
jgi:alkylhydroperoxidase/carboxymuconolactone decarboxylase family protein YurZ